MLCMTYVLGTTANAHAVTCTHEGRWFTITGEGVPTRKYRTFHSAIHYASTHIPAERRATGTDVIDYAFSVAGWDR